MISVQKKLLISAVVGVFSSFVSSTSYADDYVHTGNVYSSWKIDELSEASPDKAKLKNLTFRFNINEETLQQHGTYFAQQFYFENTHGQGNLAYLGLQPLTAGGRETRLNGIFSSFIKGTKTSDSNCHLGADGGDGVSCGFSFPAVYGRDYEFKVSKKDKHTWNGEVQDMVTNEIFHIGSWTLPESTGDLLTSGSGFVEWWSYYKPGYPQFVVPDCSLLAKINVLSGPVTTTDFGGGIGSITNVYESDGKNCKGVASGFYSHPKQISISMPNGKVLTATGQTIIRGFVSSLDEETNLGTWEKKSYKQRETVTHNYQNQGLRLYKAKWWAEPYQEPGNPNYTSEKPTGDSEVWLDLGPA